MINKKLVRGTLDCRKGVQNRNTAIHGLESKVNVGTIEKKAKECTKIFQKVLE